MTRRFIRYLAATDSSPIGMLALGYLSGLLRIAPVRVGSMTGGMSGRWEHYAQLLATPMGEDFVNVVCCARGRWTWMQGVTMMERKPDGTMGPGEKVSRRIELHTADVHNVLLTNEFPTDSDQVATALRYDAVVVPNAEAHVHWSHMRAGMRRGSTVMVAVPVTDFAALRAAVMPTTTR